MTLAATAIACVLLGFSLGYRTRALQLERYRTRARQSERMVIALRELVLMARHHVEHRDPETATRDGGC